MSLKDLILKNRSYRRFYQDVRIEHETLSDLVDHARLSASGANIQPIKYFLSSEPETNDLIFPKLGWAAYLKDWPGPEDGEKPSAYIIILGDTNLRPAFGIDPGIAAQSILLAATERSLGGCIIATIQKEELTEALKIPKGIKILFVIALGKPKESVQIEPLKQDGDIQYWRDDEGVHHVPKRPLDDLIIN